MTTLALTVTIDDPAGGAVADLYRHVLDEAARLERDFSRAFPDASPTAPIRTTIANLRALAYALPNAQAIPSDDTQADTVDV